MLRIGKTEKLFNRENKPYYEIQIFLNTLSDIKWVNNYAAGCHMTDRKQKDSIPQSKDEIELLYYFKHKKYLERFIEKIKKHINYEVVS